LEEAEEGQRKTVAQHTSELRKLKEAKQAETNGLKFEVRAFKITMKNDSEASRP
jgi:hypothetical protein